MLQTLQSNSITSEDLHVQNEVFTHLSAAVRLLSALVFFGGLGILVLKLWRYSWRPQESHDSTLTRTLGRFFHQRVRHFKAQIQTLDEHANEYTSVFCNEDWSDLRRTIAYLEERDTQIQGLLVTGQVTKAHQLLTDIYNPDKHPLDSIQTNIDSFRSCAEWEAHVRSMLKRVVTNLEAATAEVSLMNDPRRPRKRRPTLVTLADVKKSLLEDEAISRERA